MGLEALFGARIHWNRLLPHRLFPDIRRNRGREAAPPFLTLWRCIPIWRVCLPRSASSPCRQPACLPFAPGFQTCGQLLWRVILLIYDAFITRRAVSGQDGIATTRRSMAPAGAGEAWLWHGAEIGADSARGWQNLPRPLRPVRPRNSPANARPGSTSSGPLRGRRPAPIMSESNRPTRTDRQPGREENLS